MFDAFTQGILATFQPELLLVILIGSLFGVIVGITPTVGGIFGLAMLLPFTFRATPEIGLGLMCAFAAVTATGGSMTSILTGIPGTSINTATLEDGFPMARRGEGARAVGAALTSSMFGGLLAVGMAFIMIPLIVPLIMAFKMGDMAVLMLCAILLIAVVSKESILKGIISGILGMMFSLVGIHEATGVQRFSYSSVFLLSGLDMMSVLIGLFGLSAMIEMVVSETKTISASTGRVRIKLSDLLVGVGDVLRHKWLFLRSGIIGYLIGVLPAAGASIAAWTCYGLAKRSSKTPELFGKGCVEGVIAPETANNACEAGDVLTTLVFGIPGSAPMVLIMGAILLVGIIPGPAMVREHLPLVFTLLNTMAVSSVIAAVICFGAGFLLIRIVYVPFQFLFAAILPLVFVATYAEKGTLLSTLTAIVFGVLGFVMGKFGYSRPAFALGFILANIFEYQFFGALKLQGPLFFMTPISISLIVLVTALALAPYLKRTFSRLLGRRREYKA